MATQIIEMLLLLASLQTQLTEAKAQYFDEQTITFNELPIELQFVSLCESNAKQSARGPYGEIGLMQINKIHIPTAKKLGLNVYDASDNLKFALYLYEKNGLKDWYSSRKCWQKQVAQR